MSEPGSECLKQGTTESVFELSSRWIKEFLSDWSLEARTNGWANAPGAKQYLNLLNSKYNVEPVIVGKELGQAALSSDPKTIDRAMNKMDNLTADERALAACVASKFNQRLQEQIHKLGPADLPKLEIEVSSKNFGPKRVDSITVKDSNREIAARDYKVSFEEISSFYQAVSSRM